MPKGAQAKERMVEMKAKILKGAALAVACVCLFGTSTYASISYTATGGPNGSYTPSIGPGTSARYNYKISASGGGFLMQIKDPYLWHNCDNANNLSKGAEGKGTVTGGSKTAHWRGRAVNGKITVTV